MNIKKPDDKKGYYAIIPANVRYDRSLPPNAKLLYGEITALCNQNGLCWAENSYFAELYMVAVRTVKCWINALIERGYIQRNIQYAEDGRTVLYRCLSITSEITTPCEKNHEGEEKINTTLVKKISPIIIHSNTTFNTTDITPLTPRSKKAKILSMLAASALSENAKASLVEWLEYKKYKYEEMGFKSLLTIVAGKIEIHGEKAVCDLITECMSNTWEGIIWEKLEKTAHRPPQLQPPKLKEPAYKSRDYSPADIAQSFPDIYNCDNLDDI